uniref:Putative secreted protein n=1 Tax=Amblyomma parvum TaxID=251391 RepID=A0A023G0C3_AMBPA
MLGRILLSSALAFLIAVHAANVEPPRDTNPDCRATDSTGHTYQTCTFTCSGDEVFSLDRNESCFLQPTEMTPEKVPVAIDRSELGAERKGRCEGGKCVP